jgi:hypothetical protein
VADVRSMRTGWVAQEGMEGGRGEVGNKRASQEASTASKRKQGMRAISYELQHRQHQPFLS